MTGFELFTEEQKETKEVLPLFKEISIDFETGEHIKKEKELVIATGNNAIKIWVWKVLKTKRNKFKAYTSSYGNDLDENIGTIYDESIKKILIENEIKECLGVNPYITNIYDFEFNINELRILKVKFKLETIYGNTESEVEFWTL